MAGTTGNVEGGQAMGSVGRITGRDQWSVSLVTVRAGKLLSYLFSKGKNPIRLKPVCRITKNSRILVLSRTSASGLPSAESEEAADRDVVICKSIP